MAQISAKTRKILWAKAANHCAMCKHTLVEDEGILTGHFVIGEECHIIAQNVDGPRFDPTVSTSLLHSYDNLILLCPTCHTKIDKNVKKYTVARVKELKQNHEAWVHQRLNTSLTTQATELEYLFLNASRIKSGQKLISNILGCHSFTHSYEEALSKNESDLIAEFLEIVTTIDVYEESGSIVDLGWELSRLINAIEDKEQYIYVATRELKLMHASWNAPLDWRVAYIVLSRKNLNEMIFQVPKQYRF
jgi:hypothetical protein